MRYLVKARVKPGREKALLRAIADGSLGRGSIAGDEYLEDMRTARASEDGTAQWVEVCFCVEPLEEERPYWEEYFELLAIKDAHARRNCHMKTELKRGRVVTATARTASKKNCVRSGNRFMRN